MKQEAYYEITMRVGDRVVIDPGWSYWDMTNCPPWDRPVFEMAFAPVELVVEELYAPCIRTHFCDFRGRANDGRVLAFVSAHVTHVKEA